MRKHTVGVIFLAALFLFSGTYGSLRAESVDSMNQKMALETQMEARVKSLLSSFLGTSRVIPIVSIALVEKNPQDRAAAEVMRKWDESEEMVLPGVPAAASMTKNSREDAPKKNLNRLGVSRISVQVLVGARLDDKKAEKVKQIIAAAFALDTAAGDVVTVESYRSSDSSSLFGPITLTEILLLLGLGVLGFFLFGPFKAFLKSLAGTLAAGAAPPEKPAGNMTASPAADDDEAAEKDEEEQLPGVPALPGTGPAVSGGLSTQEEGLDFSRIINRDTIDDVRTALAQESPEIIAQVVQRLPANLAGEAIPPEKRTEVVALFSATVFAEPDKVKETMQRVKTRVEWCFGGVVKLARILQPMERDAQEAILESLRAKDPAFAGKVESRLFRFTDLLLYEDAGLKRIYRKSGAEPFARCFKRCPDTLVQEFSVKLGPSIMSLITNRLKTMITAGSAAEAEAVILQAINGLSQKGFIPGIEEIKQLQAQQRVQQAQEPPPPPAAPQQGQS